MKSQQIDLTPTFQWHLHSIKVNDRKMAQHDGKTSNLVAFRFCVPEDRDISFVGHFVLTGVEVLHERLIVNGMPLGRLASFKPNVESRVSMIEVIPDDGYFNMRVELVNGDEIVCVLTDVPSFWASGMRNDGSRMATNSTGAVDKLPHWDDDEGIILFSPIDLL